MNETAADAAPGAAEALQQLTEMLLLADETAAAAAVLAELAVLDPHAAAKGQTARAWIEGHLGQALLLARQCGQRRPEDLEAARLTALCLTALGRQVEARHTLEAALARQPQSPATWLHLIELTAETLDLPQTRQAIHAALAACPRAAVLHVALARWWLKADAPEAAVEAYRQALLCAPGDTEVWLESATVLAQATTVAAAAAWLEVALSGPLAGDEAIAAAVRQLRA